MRVWGLSVTEDQQLAGAIMKTGGSIFLWTIIVWMWFKRFSATHRDEHNYKRRSRRCRAEPSALADVAPSPTTTSSACSPDRPTPPNR